MSMFSERRRRRRMYNLKKPSPKQRTRTVAVFITIHQRHFDTVSYTKRDLREKITKSFDLVRIDVAAPLSKELCGGVIHAISSRGSKWRKNDEKESVGDLVFSDVSGPRFRCGHLRIPGYYRSSFLRSGSVERKRTDRRRGR